MVLPPTTLLARYSYSQALARSSALSALEEKLDVFLSSVSALPVTLSHTGQVGLKRKEVIMKLGELMIFRQGLNLNHENFLDMPDFYWAEPKLEGMFVWGLVWPPSDLFLFIFFKILSTSIYYILLFISF